MKKNIIVVLTFMIALIVVAAAIGKVQAVSWNSMIPGTYLAVNWNS